MLTNDQIKNRLTERFGDQLTGFQESYGMMSFEAPKDMNLKVLNFLFDDEELRFRFMACCRSDPSFP